MAIRIQCLRVDSTDPGRLAVWEQALRWRRTHEEEWGSIWNPSRKPRGRSCFDLLLLTVPEGSSPKEELDSSTAPRRATRRSLTTSEASPNNDTGSGDYCGDRDGVRAEQISAKLLDQYLWLNFRSALGHHFRQPLAFSFRKLTTTEHAS
jgi:hypothetical protein